jgi:exonuclease SbcC
MENIRSYKKEKIPFPLGAVLFEGDIGSGKSTILHAIEFALFGLGDTKGGYLLRHGEPKGRVELEIQVDNTCYIVGRTLNRRGDQVGQGKGYLEVNNTRMEYSAGELRKKVLEILRFNEPLNSRAHSVIFRYAIFTPQERMKEVLGQKPEERLKTLRKAFGIEEYSTARNNAEFLMKAIKERAGYLKTKSEDIDKKKKELEERKSELKGKEGELKEVNKRLDEIEKVIKELEKELEKLREIKIKAEKLKEIIKDIQNKLKNDREQLKNMLDQLSKLNELLQKKIRDISELEKIKDPTDKTIEELEKELREFGEEEKKVRDKRSKIEAKIDDFKKIVESGTCPTCERDVEPSAFKRKIENKEKEKEELDKLVQELEIKIKNNKEIQEKKRKYNEAQRRIKELREEIANIKTQINFFKNEARKLENNIQANEATLEALKEELNQLEESIKQIEKIEQDLKEARAKKEELVKKKGSIEAEIKNLKEQIKVLEEDIKIMEKQRERMMVLIGHMDWLRDFFIPTVENIERNVLASINFEFNRLFQKWFNMLIEYSDITVSVDETFTPVIEQSGYEIDVDSLSGGEKTSVALAYRLALNTMVKKTTNAKSNLIILDEPTDGFSNEQLYRMREVIEDLKCEQVVIVSHEKELESFADSIFKVEKIQGASMVV